VRDAAVRSLKFAVLGGKAAESLRGRGSTLTVPVLGLLTLVGCPAACRKTDAPPGSTEARTAAAAVASADAVRSPMVGDAAPTTPGAGPQAPPVSVREGCAGASAKRIPESADPLGGAFDLSQAVEGLDGDGAGLTAVLETSVATLRCVLDADRAPRTVANFVGLARGVRPWWDPCRGAWVREPFYDGVKFHRLQAGFLAQAGCPIGDGTGGPGYALPDEILPDSLHDATGVLSMANVGPGTAGSQFFVTLGPAPELDRRHTVFGRCVSAESLAKLDAAARSGEAVVLRRVTIERSEPGREGGAT
jgi:peptidyl-prolyl cis-trans isomerase A (cyclophilin A)